MANFKMINFKAKEHLQPKMEANTMEPLKMVDFMAMANINGLMAQFIVATT